MAQLLPEDLRRNAYVDRYLNSCHVGEVRGGEQLLIPVIA